MLEIDRFFERWHRHLPQACVVDVLLKLRVTLGWFLKE
jgi:hypothetical protein